MIYELWDVESANLVGSYDSKAAALVVVRDAVNRHGADYVEGLALVREDARGASRTLAEGSLLLDRALSAPTLLASADD